MWLHNMFYPNYISISDYSVFEKFMFLQIPVPVVSTIPVPVPSEIKEISKKPVPIEIQEMSKKPGPIEIKEIQEMSKKPVPIQTRLEKECLIAKNVQDGLFWSMYIAHYGYNEYNRNKYNYGKLEVQEKEKIAEYLHTNSKQKQKQTNYKLTRGFCCEIESDLITKPKMPFSGLIGMCAMYSCNIVVVDLTKHIYYLFSSNTDHIDIEEEDNIQQTQTYILYKNPLYTGLNHKSNEYFVDIDHKIYSYVELKEHFFKIENYQKPMKSITNYKKIELEYILKVLNLTGGDGKEDKPQLYEKIILHLNNEL